MLQLLTSGYFGPLILSGGIATWLALRAPSMLARRKCLQSRKQALNSQRAALISELTGSSGSNQLASTNTSLEEIQPFELSPCHLIQNWKWLLAGLLSASLGVLSFSYPHAPELLIARNLSQRQVPQVYALIDSIWGWPVSVLGITFSLLCLFGSFTPMED